MAFREILYPLVLVVLVGAAFWEWRNIRLGIAALRWRKVRGQALKAFVDESPDNHADDVVYSAHVRYSYKIGSRRFESTRLAYRATRGLVFDNALDLLHGIVQGREVDVFYDPRKPERSVLVPGSSADNLARLCLLLVFVAACIWHWLFR